MKGDNGEGEGERDLHVPAHILNGSSLTVLKKFLEVSFGNSDNHLAHTQQLQHGRTDRSFTAISHLTPLSLVSALNLVNVQPHSH